MTANPPLSGASAPITPEDMVRDHTAELLNLTSTAEFDRLAIEYGFATGHLKDRFVIALLAVGIDYEGLARIENARTADDGHLARQAATGPKMMVWSAATMQAFTVCAANGRLIWHEPFADIDEVVDGVAAATVSAEKAIELAGHAVREWGGDAGVLRLNLARSRGVDLARLHGFASSRGLVLGVATVAVHNPAAEQCTHPDPVVWYTTDLHELWQRPETSS
ncbi:hypothetical protein [Nocardia sp. NPDC058666]|uniref:hypothetical protein n=1 Tax=unclassified Nocardia TaxID=2637762 RepID=UPI00365536BF